jgi:hypothetical protein
MDALAGATTSGQYLRGNGSDVVMSAIQVADVPTLNQNTSGNATTATTATNLAGGSAGTIPYQSAAGTTAMLAIGSSGQVLQSNGAAAPSWAAATAAANNGTLTLAVSGTGLSGSATFTANQSTSSTFTVTSNATSANTVSAIVARDGSGNFSAGTITATLTGNVTGNVTGNTSGSAATFTSTSQNSQFNSIGVGTAGSTTAGEIRATNNITAYYSSDIKFKENVRNIPNAAITAAAIGGKLFDWKAEYIEEHGGEDGYFIVKADFGVIAQDVLAKFPVAVRTRPDGSLAVDYEKLSALALAANAEHEERIAKLEALVATLIKG